MLVVAVVQRLQAELVGQVAMVVVLQEQKMQMLLRLPPIQAGVVAVLAVHQATTAVMVAQV
jgi:hypothetical protein